MKKHNKMCFLHSLFACRSYFPAENLDLYEDLSDMQFLETTKSQFNTLLLHNNKAETESTD